MPIAPDGSLGSPASPKARSLPQTYGTIGLALGGWVGLLVWLGLRPVVWVGGSIATVVMLGWWLGEVRRLPAPKVSEDLLEAATLERHLAAIEPLAGRSAAARQLWTTIAQDTQALRSAAADIAQRDAALLPDLYEAIVTGLGLAERAARASAAIETVQTAPYRKQAQLQQNEAIARLQATRAALTELRDSMVLGAIETREARSTLPTRLNLIVEDNRATLKKRSTL